MKSKKIVLTILLTNLFIAFLGIGLVIPVLPTIMNELEISGSVVGYMVAAFAITQLIFSPIAGRWVDKYGRKIMIVVGLFIFGASEFLFGMGKTVEVLFVSRMLGGVSAAFIMPAVTAFIADITTASSRSKALGYMSAAISTGFIIGPGIGGFLAEIGTRVPFYSAGVLGAACSSTFYYPSQGTGTRGGRNTNRRTDNRAAPYSYSYVFHRIYINLRIIIWSCSF